VESLRASDAVSDAQRARAEARDLAGRVGSLESRVERLRERERELETEVERARAGRSEPHAEPRAERAPAAVEEAEAGEVETWLFPIYTREFYDSLEGWDRRIQRGAFKQANLLALDHRHPSLRALPLEGLPGYYRVRVATDVRLIYRRPERQNVVEILSLIDREDLDRYIRQAKTRG
jgi:mRNA-degrading endonuclease RelE of RelBE toxin-antitoxin system